MLFFFIKALRKGKEMKWTEECEEAFQKLKEYLRSPHLLVKPIQDESLFLYLVVSEHATSYVLVREDDGIQNPIYYTSKALFDAKTRYLSLEKIVLTLIVSARRLRLYFQAHTIIVLTDKPIRQVLAKPDISGKMTKWAIELGEFDILYHPRKEIKLFKDGKNHSRMEIESPINHPRMEIKLFKDRKNHLKMEIESSRNHPRMEIKLSKDGNNNPRIEIESSRNDPRMEIK